MNIPLDETMSQDPAFTGNGESKDDIFNFDTPVGEETPTDSQPESSIVVEEEQAEVTETSEQAGSEEQRVPYSRFKSKIAEVEQKESIIKDLEDRLSYLEQSKIESTPSEDLEVPQEWVELYGDSDASKRAFKLQLQREEKLMEDATKNAINQLKAETEKQIKMAEENELYIEESLSSLHKKLGKKLPADVEDEVLTIVDEFSPVDESGKYISLFPFDKAYEIYELRNGQAKQSTIQARNQVANLTGNTSEGESDSSSADFKRGWDNWREAL